MSPPARPVPPLVLRRPSPAGRHAAESRLAAAAFEASPDAVVISDGRGRILRLNPAAARLLGRPAARARGRRLSDLLAAPPPAATHGGAAEGAEAVATLRRPGGAGAPVALRSRTLRGGRHPLRATFLRELPAGPREPAAAPAGDAGRTAALLSGVAHEINNPLAILLAQATLLRERAPDPEVARRAEALQAAAARIERVVATFLTLAPHRPPELAATDLDAAVDAALADAGGALRRAGIGVERRRPLAPLPPVRADRAVLGRVFAHVLAEARAALAGRDGERRITVASALEGGEVVLTYSDSGPGPGPAVTGLAAGGVGASLCRTALDPQGGSLHIDRGPGGGTRVRIALPAMAAGPAPAMRVLVVDDEADVGASLAELIELSGHAVTLAGSAGEALALTDRQPFDALFTDLHMPGPDGRELRAALAARDPRLHARTVLVTADTVAGSPGIGELRLAKPFTAAAVRAVLDRLRAA